MSTRSISVQDWTCPGYAEILQTCIVLMSAEKGNLQILDPAAGTLSIAAQIGFSLVVVSRHWQVPHHPTERQLAAMD
jgi:hypothetical protein